MWQTVKCIALNWVSCAIKVGLSRHSRVSDCLLVHGTILEGISIWCLTAKDKA